MVDIQLLIRYEPSFVDNLTQNIKPAAANLYFNGLDLPDLAPCQLQKAFPLIYLSLLAAAEH